ncbi:U3 small nucleolar RNA-associated protein 11 [Amniculicola lignicola CBS 123094]|uniref:U3 small nucleolar RNA-associated protein 11 n=1 Tax=Amniculicola lignicola CBS 123094 TaxID=1392246 RepID=A0A6A5WY91_9PLEO|nr:U3 small nucleolar RNA-associated protein 11 [Amniculicola lignicola CBS 123094]
MSSMRNAVQRRNHKERAQPLEREKWGLLEKRKDYKLRAADHKTKQKRLKLLKQKATERNPDEFSFKMMSSQVDSAGRRITDRGNKALSQDVVKLLKTQDLGYLRTTIQELRNEREQVEHRLILDDNELVVLKDGEDTRQGKHTVFVGDKEVQKKFKPDEWFGTAPELVNRAWNRPRKEIETDKNEWETDEESQPKKLSKKQLEAELLARKEERATTRRRERAHERVAAHLEGLKARERDLTIAIEELENQRAKMNNTIGGINKHGVKFKIRERKR